MDTLTNRTGPRPSTARAMAASVLAVACGAASAEPEAEEPPAARPRLELASEPVNRMDFAHPGTRLDAITWAGSDAHAFGIALGGRFDRRASAMPWQAPPPETSLNVGLRWRSALSDRRRVDVAAWRDVAVTNEERAGLTTRIEMQFTSPRSSVNLAEFGAIGMQLDGNTKLQLKIRSGKPMFYYRSKF